ncbi:hypothetical protein KXD93_20445 [Mucilaginibacter sp. BJC16-A38]|uniref:hypothetical protein n=1 Tax=Mucilaginibacter phenanthrenivorans TaxID=1234842 RepID=UPI002157FC36|nr:hypothetical protein [Mucilaginibacter phenanthrenivorans]MCR8560033.1 hypothetical protein [Mucilaginibacter phenanthrenivorans]
MKTLKNAIRKIIIASLLPIAAFAQENSMMAAGHLPVGNTATYFRNRAILKRR